MIRAECDILLDALQGTFARRYSPETRDRVWERVRDVPGGLVQAVTERIEALDEHPKNLANAILAAWRALTPASAGEAGKWLNPCPECDPGRWKGRIVFFTRRADGRIHKQVCDCALCRPASADKATRGQLAARGALVPPTPQDVARWYFRMFRANNAALARRVEARSPVLAELARQMEEPETVPEAKTENKHP